MRILSKAAALFLTAAVAFSVAPAWAQQFRLQPASVLTVDGTSNKSDWTVRAGEVNGTISLAGGGKFGVQSAKIVVPAMKLAGGKSTIMDRLMHESLKAEQHPEIVFDLSKATVVQAPPAGKPGKFALKADGRLTLAGVTKPITMDIQGERLANGSYKFAGAYPLNMRDYEITPPTALFGALHTGENVTIKFDVVGAAEAAQ